MQVIGTKLASHYVNLPAQPASGQGSRVAQGRRNPRWMGLPERLKRTRQRAGLSQRQVARLALCDWRIPHRVEAGYRTSIDLVEQLAAGLGVPAAWLAFGPEAGLPFQQKQMILDTAEADPPSTRESAVFCARYKDCGARVRQTRQRLGLTLVAVAEGARMSHQAVLNTETGATIPRLDTVEAIAVALHVSPGWLAYGDEGALDHVQNLDQVSLSPLDEKSGAT